MKKEVHPADGIVADVRTGQIPRPEALLSFLSVADGALRAQRLFALSEAFSEVGDNLRAAQLARRTLAVSGYDRSYLEPCVTLLGLGGDVEGLREALKRAGVDAAKEQRVVEALELFNRSLYAYATHYKQDRYVYDFEMLAAIDTMAVRFRRAIPSVRAEGRIRIAVLVFGALHVGSVLVKILATFAEHVDRSRFELAFFVPETARAVSQSASAQGQLAALRGSGWSVSVPRSNDPLQVLVNTASAIHKWAPDTLLTSALCADLRHYFISSTRPAPRTIALVQGPPPQFTVPWVDWNIAVSAHPGMDTPGNCSVVPLELTLPTRAAVELERRSQYGLSPESKLIVSGGRPSKFESAKYWSAIAEILSRHPESVYMFIGVNELPRAARDCLSTDLVARVRPVAWRDDYLRVLGLADVVLDTYPSGGGVVLLDAMALGIPAVSFANDYLHEFDQTDWGLGNEFVIISELVAPRHDFARLIEIVDGLLTDPIHRARLGQQCEALVRSQRGSPARMVCRWEEVLSGVIGRPPVADDLELRRGSSREPRLARVLRWISRTKSACR